MSLFKEVKFLVAEGLASFPATHLMRELQSSQWLNRSDMQELQLLKLRHRVTQAYNHIPFYRKKLLEYSVTPQDIKDLSSLEKLPVITKTELKEATEVRNKSELKYRNLYDNASDLYRVANKNGIIIDCNKAYAESLGYTKDEIIGHQSTLDHTASASIDALKRFAEDWQKTMRVMNREIWLKRKDGTTFPCLVSSTALHDENGDLIGSNTIIKDITEIYVARKRIEELEKQLGQQGQLKAQ